VFLVLIDSNVETRTAALQLLARNLRDRILRPASGRASPRRRISRALKHFPTPTSVSVNTHPSGNYSTMELVAQDRPGLLHVVATGLIDCKVELISARISTFGERAEDIFLITNRDGEPVTDPEQLSCLQDRIVSLVDDVSSAA
jgi:[protein-PII] uridylyltransferase